jgi:hypothetical protein
VDDKDKYQLKIRRRSWYEWLLWTLWLFFEIVFLQSAIASHKEFEPRAAAIYWMMFGLLLLGSIVVWLFRRIQSM